MDDKKKQKFDEILKDSSVEKEKNTVTKEEKIELKTYAIHKALKLKKYVRN